MKEKKTILVQDIWYIDYFTVEVNGLDNYIFLKYGKWMLNLCNKNKFLKGYLFFRAARHFDVVVALIAERICTHTFLLFQFLFAKKRNNIILLEFIYGAPRKKIFKIVWPIFINLVWSKILAKVLAKAHVLSLAEVEYYSKYFSIPDYRFKFIPWPLHNDMQNKPPNQDGFIDKENSDFKVPYVMVSGLLNVDWETVFAAAKQSDWHLLAVCTSKHLKRVNDLNKDASATVFHDISGEEHSKYLRGAAVYALCLDESDVSVGQIRLMNTRESSVPTVVTNVSGLRDYVVDGVNGILVPPKDAVKLKQALDLLMKDKEYRQRLVESAAAYQKSDNFSNYIKKVISFIEET